MLMRRVSENSNETSINRHAKVEKRTTNTKVEKRTTNTKRREYYHNEI